MREDPWKPFQDAVADPWAGARGWKERTGGKVVGHLLPDVPEEIIHAAGALPVGLEGAGEPISRAQAHIPGYTCAHAMGALEMGLKGKLDLLDGMIIPYVCDTTRNLFHIWSRNFPRMPSEFLRFPKRFSHEGARNYLHAEFHRLMEFLGGLTGSAVDSDHLAASLTLYNRSRSELRRAYEMHRRAPGVWTCRRIRLLFASSIRVPREDHLEWMARLPWRERACADPGERIPVYVRGKVWDPPEFVELLDDLGFILASDELVTGYRAIANDAPLDGDPVMGLVERHFAAAPYPGYHREPRSAPRAFVDRVRESRASGVIFLNPKFCETAGFDTPDLQKALESEGAPAMILETSAGSVSIGQIRVRLEAFREMLASDLP